MFLITDSIKPIRRLTHLDVKPLDGKNGKDADENKIVSEVLAKIPMPENGKDGLQGKDGKAGENGKDGKPGKDGARGLAGKDGKPGKDAPSLKEIIDNLTPFIPEAINGKDGETPEHEVDKKRLRIRFKKPNGDWGEWIELGKELSKLIAKQVGFVNRGGTVDNHKTQRDENTDSWKWDYESIDSESTVSGTHTVYEVDGSTGDFDITVSATAIHNNILFKRIDDTANNINIKGSIDFVESVELKQQGSWLWLKSKGDKYYTWSLDNGMTRATEESVRRQEDILIKLTEIIGVLTTIMNVSTESNLEIEDINEDYNYDS
jgi:hypothetical protein